MLAVVGLESLTGRDRALAIEAILDLDLEELAQFVLRDLGHPAQLDRLDDPDRFGGDGPIHVVVGFDEHVFVRPALHQHADGFVEVGVRRVAGE